MSEVQATEMSFLRTVKGCDRRDKLRNKDIQRELNVTESINEGNNIQIKLVIPCRKSKYQIKW
jgi:hypothetical protein